MLFVLFLTCSLSTGDKCRQDVMRISEEPLTPMACLKAAQPQLANWTLYHPNRHIKTFKCVDENRKNRELEQSL